MLFLKKQTGALALAVLGQIGPLPPFSEHPDANVREAVAV